MTQLGDSISLENPIIIGDIMSRHDPTGRRTPPITPSPAGYNFDPASGLQFIETTSAMATGENDRNWLYESNLTLTGILRQRNVPKTIPKNSKTLQDTVFEHMVENISRFSSEAIAFLPVHLAEKLLDLLHKRKRISFHVFTVFLAALRNNTKKINVLKYQKHILHPKSPLEIYTTPLTSTSLDFLTMLSIITPLHLVDLVKLSSIKNLVALEIVSSDRRKDTGVDDRLVRAWSFAARDEAAFPVLRLLRLWNHSDLTTRSLVSLDSFPALAIYDIRGCSLKTEPNRCFQGHNWRACMNESVLGALEELCVTKAKDLRKRFKDKHASTWDEFQPHSPPNEVRWMAREDVPEYLAESVAARAPSTSTSKSTRHPYFSHEARPSLFPPRSSWDTELYTSIARIGELRKDQDLSSHINIGHQALLGTKLVNSVPIASLRLGPTPDCLNLDRLVQKGYDLAFVHLSLTNPVSPIVPLSKILTEEMAEDGDVAFAEMSLKLKMSLASSRRKGTGLRECTVPDEFSEGLKAQQPMKRRKTGEQKNKGQDLEGLLRSFS